MAEEKELGGMKNEVKCKSKDNKRAKQDRIVKTWSNSLILPE